MKKTQFLSLLLAGVFMLNIAQAQAAVVASSDQSGGYSNSVLDAVVKKWRPPLDGNEQTIRILAIIDGNGKLEECSALTNTKVTPAEKAACDAVRSIGQFAAPPYGLPMDVFLSFWVGEVDGTNNLPPANNPSVKHASTNPSVKQTSFAKNEQKSTSSSKLTPPKDNTDQNTRTTQPIIQDNRGNAVLDEDDFYVKMVMRKIGPHVQFPPNLPNKELSTSLTVQVDASGNIKDIKLAQSSGSEDLDNAIIKATQKTGKVNPPPDSKARELFLTFIIKA